MPTYLLSIFSNTISTTCWKTTEFRFCGWKLWDASSLINNHFATWEVDMRQIALAKMTQELNWEIAATMQTQITPQASSCRWEEIIWSTVTGPQMGMVAGKPIYVLGCMPIWQFSQVITLGHGCCCYLCSAAVVSPPLPKFRSSSSKQQDDGGGRLKPLLRSFITLLSLLSSYISTFFFLNVACS